MRALVATVALLLVFSQIAGAQLRGVKAELTPRSSQMRHQGLLFAPLCRFEFQIGFTFNRTHLATRRSSRRCSR